MLYGDLWTAAVRQRICCCGGGGSAVVVVVVVELCDLPVVDPADFVTGDLSWLSGLPGQLT